MPENEVEQFLKDTNPEAKQVDVLEQSLVDPLEAPLAEPTEPVAVEGEQGELKPRNRRERRLMEKLDAERQSNIFQAGKLAAFSEAKSAITEESDYLKSVERIYGTDSPEAQLATDLLKKAIVGAREDAKRDAIAEIRAEREREVADLQSADQELDTMIEEIEDEYGVTLTEPQERAYFQLLVKMSPKDKNGEVRDYADAHAVWEVFQEKLKARPVTNPAKAMSSRSMTQSGSSKESNLNEDVTARFLKDQGII